MLKAARCVKNHTVRKGTRSRTRGTARRQRNAMHPTIHMMEEMAMVVIHRPGSCMAAKRQGKPHCLTGCSWAMMSGQTERQLGDLMQHAQCGFAAKIQLLKMRFTVCCNGNEQQDIWQTDFCNGFSSWSVLHAACTSNKFGRCFMNLIFDWRDLPNVSNARCSGRRVFCTLVIVCLISMLASLFSANCFTR